MALRVCQSKRCRIAAGAAVFLLVALAVIWCFRAPVLHTLAECWVVNDAPGKADAIVILGGGEQFRPQEAARLYHAGAAAVILLPHQTPRPTDVAGVTRAPHDVCFDLLQKLGVPADAIHPMNTSVHTTFEEAQVIRDWAVEHHARRIIVPTDYFHSRRARWIFRRLLAPVKTDAVVVSVSPGDYDTSNWWQSENGVVTFQNEVCKMILYWLKN